MKTLMHATILVAAICSILSQTAIAQQSNCPERRTISVNGRGEVKAAADMALAHFAVETTAATAASAAELNAQISAKVGAALKAMIGSGDKIETTSYSLQPRYDTPKREPGEPKIIGYVASNEVQVETAAIGSIGKLIDAAITAGANRVNNLTFTLRDRNEYVRKALDQAGAEAKAQAEATAHALGVKIKQILSATTMAPPIIQDKVFEGFGRAAMAQATTPVEPGEVSVWAELSVVFEIE